MDINKFKINFGLRDNGEEYKFNETVNGCELSIWCNWLGFNLYLKDKDGKTIGKALHYISRHDKKIIGEDLKVYSEFRNNGYGSFLVKTATDFARLNLPNYRFEIWAKSYPICNMFDKETYKKLKRKDNRLKQKKLEQFYLNNGFKYVSKKSGKIIMEINPQSDE